MTPTYEPTLESLEAASEIVAQTARRTPLVTARFLTAMLGSEVLLKCENLQRTGSYKIRGATNRLARLDAGERARGVVAASAGNHAQGVAYAARRLGIDATIFMPRGVAIPKLEATRAYGAEVVLTGTGVADALEGARRRADETGAVFIHPYDHPDIIAGQASLGLEILDDAPDIDTILVPVGGGGLASGIAIAARRIGERQGKRIRVIGVQAANSAAFPPSIRSGHPVRIDASPTIADGVAVAEPGAITFEVIRDLVDEIVTVSEAEIARAILLLLERAKLVTEAAGAISVAAIESGKVRGTGRTVAVLSGGNIDPMMLEKVIAGGLAAADRYLKLIFALPDIPGQLARISAILADADANVIEVLHTRHNKGLQITQVELEVSVETRGSEHTRQVLDALAAGGYHPSLGKPTSAI